MKLSLIGQGVRIKFLSKLQLLSLEPSKPKLGSHSESYQSLPNQGDEIMDQQSMAKQMIELQKTTFDNMMNNMIIFWNQTGTLMSACLNMAVWLPEDGKKTLMGLIESGKNGCENFKNAFDSGYSKMAQYFHPNGSDHTS
jgi:hypothetical protein